MEASSTRRIVRVLSNNAVLTRDGETEMVLLGRGIGFGRTDGDIIDEASIQQRYIEIDPERAEFMNWANALGNNLVEVIGHALDIASDVLGHLHPAVYTLLLDHIAFAIQRVRVGEQIANPLTPQIREMYPDEFDAARLALRYLNNHLDVKLPADEAGFIALHLNAGRAGETVKQPLQRANELAGLVDQVTKALATTNPRLREQITRVLVGLSQRLRAGTTRRNAATQSIRRDLAADYEVSSRIISTILDVKALPKHAEGEAAFLAVQIHGWRQDLGIAAGNNRKGTK